MLFRNCEVNYLFLNMNRYTPYAITFINTHMFTYICWPLLHLFKNFDGGNIAKNYRGLTFTGIAANIYNALLLKRITPEIEKFLLKNQNGFQRNQSTLLSDSVESSKEYVP